MRRATALDQYTGFGTRPLTTFVAILRGINVGGHRKLPMADLRQMCERLGFENPRTYVQSGNVAFRTRQRRGPAVENRLTTAIREEFGYEVPVLVRTEDDLRRVITGNPFIDEGETDTSILHVTFLGRPPTSARRAGLKCPEGIDEDLRMGRDEVYLRCPNGCARSKLSNAWFEEQLGVSCTTRNWKTVQALLNLISDR